MVISRTELQYLNWINGEWKSSLSDEWICSRNPADVSDILGYFPNMDRGEAEYAVESAAAAFSDWSVASPSFRASILRHAATLLDERAEQYGQELTREEGKLLPVAVAEVRRAAATLRFFAEVGMTFTGETFPSDDSNGLVYSVREPLGVVTVITPWNFPISIPARKIAPALVAGNTVVFKPASDTPLIALRLVECLVESGLPSGVLNFVTGSANRVGPALTQHTKVKAVTFTGSTAAGEHIHRSVALTTRTQMELGGKNPLLVLEDADLELAVQLAIKGGFDLTGQACTGTSRVIVMQSVYDSFVERLAERTRALSIGNGLHAGMEVGPLANESQLQTVLDYVELGQQEGAELVCGGVHLTTEEYGKGYFVTPAVFKGVRSEMRIAQEEIFGPVMAVIPAASFAEAVHLANDVEYGLTAAIVTNDLKKASMFARQIESGTVKVNRTTTGNLIHAPFGGVKRSSTSTFRESGRSAFEFFTQLKTVYFSY